MTKPETLRQLPDVAAGQTWRLHFGAPSAPEPWGSGQRVLIILAAGRKWITAVSPETLHVDKVHVNDWHKHRPRQLDQTKARALRSIRQRRTLYNRLGVAYPVKTLRDYLKHLEGGA